MTSIAGLSLCFVLLAIPAVAQQNAPPTSVPLEKTLTPIFKNGEVTESLATAEAYSNFRIFLDYDAVEPAHIILRDDHSVEFARRQKP